MEIETAPTASIPIDAHDRWMPVQNGRRAARIDEGKVVVPAVD